MWSESLSWQRTLSFVGGPMLIDTQVSSTAHRSLQVSCIPTLNDIFLNTWPSRAKPSTDVANFRRRQRPAVKMQYETYQELLLRKFVSWNDQNSNFNEVSGKSGISSFIFFSPCSPVNSKYLFQFQNAKLALRPLKQFKAFFQTLGGKNGWSNMKTIRPFCVPNWLSFLSIIYFHTSASRKYILFYRLSVTLTEKHLGERLGNQRKT